MTMFSSVTKQAQMWAAGLATCLGAAGCGSTQKQSGGHLDVGGRMPQPQAQPGYPAAIVRMQDDLLQSVAIDAVRLSPSEINARIDKSLERSREAGRGAQATSLSQQSNGGAWENPLYARAMLVEVQKDVHETGKFVEVLMHVRHKPEMRESWLDALARERSPRLGNRVTRSGEQVKDALVEFAARRREEGLRLASIMEREVKVPLTDIVTQRAFPDVAAQMKRSAQVGLRALLP